MAPAPSKIAGNRSAYTEIPGNTANVIHLLIASEYVLANNKHIS